MAQPPVEEAGWACVVAVAYGKCELMPNTGDLEASEDAEVGRTVLDKELAVDGRGKGVLNNRRRMYRGSQACVMCSAA